MSRPFAGRSENVSDYGCWQMGRTMALRPIGRWGEMTMSLRLTKWLIRVGV